MEKIEDTTREQVAAFLPAALKKSIDSYYRFMGQDVPIKAKDFSDHHKAGKVAVSHVELLIKLARWADLEEEMQEKEEFAVLFAAAKKDVLKNHARTSDNDEEDEEDLA